MYSTKETYICLFDMSHICLISTYMSECVLIYRALLQKRRTNVFLICHICVSLICFFTQKRPSKKRLGREKVYICLFYRSLLSYVCLLWHIYRFNASLHTKETCGNFFFSFGRAEVFERADWNECMSRLTNIFRFYRSLYTKETCEKTWCIIWVAEVFEQAALNEYVSLLTNVSLF